MTLVKSNIVVIGGSYAGMNVVRELAPLGVHTTHNIILIEKNSDFQHLFTFPRISVLPVAVDRGFIPYTNAFYASPPDSTSIIRATATKILPDAVELHDGTLIPYAYLVLAIGLGAPVEFPLTDPSERDACIAYFQAHQKLAAKAERITVVGGGAYGVQVATDLKEYHPSKKITLIHSRTQLLNRFHHGLHAIVLDKLNACGVEVILGQRIQMPEEGFPTDGREFEITLADGRKLPTDLAIVCTGPRTTTTQNNLLESLSPAIPVPIPVKPTLQIDIPMARGEDLANDNSTRNISTRNIFVLGDVADTGAGKSARPGGVQAGVVARNISTLIAHASSTADGKEVQEEPGLEEYTPAPHSIHLGLGIRDSVVFRNPVNGSTDPTSELEQSSRESLEVPVRMWKRLGMEYVPTV